MPGFLLFFFSTRKKIQSLGEQKNNLMAIPYKNIFNTILGYSDVILNQGKNYFRIKTIKSLQKLYDILTKINVYESIPAKVIELTSIIAMSSLFVYFIIFENNKIRLLSFLVIFATAAYRIMPSLNRILSSLVRIKSTLYTLDILKEPIKKTHNKINNVKLEFKEEVQIKVFLKILMIRKYSKK